jgi:hypothetical protein
MVARNKALARATMQAELNRCEGSIRRAQDIADVLGMRAEVDQLLHEIIDLQERVALAEKGRKRRGKPGEEEARP